MSKREFEFEDKTYAFRESTQKDYEGAQKVYNEAFSNALKSKSPLRAKLQDILREQGIWDDEKERQLNTLRTELNNNEKKIAKGGITLLSAKKICLEMRRIRNELRSLLSETSALDNVTADAQAENARFNYMVSALTVYKDTKKPVFKDLAEYLERAATPIAFKAAIEWAKISNNYDDDMERKLPENKFLSDYGFVDKDLRLVNKEGKLVDEDGRLIDEDGFFVDEEGNRVDKEGDPLDEDGNYKFDQAPFLDEDGNEVVPVGSLDTVEPEESEKSEDPEESDKDKE